MEFNTFDTYQAEIEYRSNRLRRDNGRFARRTRRPFVRRPADTNRAAS